MTLALTSLAFADGEPIPTEYTCDDADRQLPLAWSGAPAGTAEFALIFDDPDAGGFVHWVVTGIPAETTEMGDELSSGAVAGRNDFGGSGYAGPCPPANHTYRLRLYALSEPLGLSGDVTADAVRRAAADKTLATATLSGTYGPRAR
jgi:Raf kinase inhibitor-like YbhB/YbcL family protein